MKFSQITLIPIIGLMLAGCEQFRQPQTSEQICPVVEQQECPICEVLECPEPQVIEKIVTKTIPAKLPPMAKTAGKLHLPIIGAVEHAKVEPINVMMEARIDTGAETTSIHAESLQLLEKDGKRYVSFYLVDPATSKQYPLELPLQRKVRIKQDAGEFERRFVVELWITLGDTRSLIEVSLTDRSNYEYSLLIGRNMLTDTMIVDVSQHHTLGPANGP